MGVTLPSDLAHQFWSCSFVTASFVLPVEPPESQQVDVAAICTNGMLTEEFLTGVFSDRGCSVALIRNPLRKSVKNTGGLFTPFLYSDNLELQTEASCCHPPAPTTTTPQ